MPSAKPRSGRGSALELLRPDSVEAAAAALEDGSVALAGGTEVVPLLRDGILQAQTLVQLFHLRTARDHRADVDHARKRVLRECGLTARQLGAPGGELAARVPPRSDGGLPVVA